MHANTVATSSTAAAAVAGRGQAARQPVCGPARMLGLKAKPASRTVRATQHRHGPRRLPEVGATAAPRESQAASPAPAPAEAGKVQVPSIRQFLKGRTIFITGATGFLAKVLVEKILFEQPDVKQLYLLVRSGKGGTGQERVWDQVMSSPAYDRLRENYGEQYEAFMASKLAAVEGELGLPALGMSPEQREKLQGEVDMVVNCAATTVFDDRFDRALRINTLGAKDVADFAAGCRSLKVMVHVSTCFTNGMRQGHTPERPFRWNESIAQELGWPDASQMDVMKVIEEGLASEKAAREQLAAECGPDGFKDEDVEQRVKDMGIQHARKYGWQDTYVLTKSLGEMLVARSAAEAHIPAVFIRPSIVEGAVREPHRGWIEGIRMCDPIFIACGKGQLPGFPGNRQGVLDVIPVDYVVHAILAGAAYNVGRPLASEEQVPIYQVAASVENPLTLDALSQYVSRHFSASPVTSKGGEPIPVPDSLIYDSVADFRHALHKLATELAGTGDGGEEPSAAARRRQEIIVSKLEEYADHLTDIYAPYTFYACRFDNSNTKALSGGLQPEEREAFSFDVSGINWEDYIVNTHIPGLRKFPLKGHI